MGFERSFNNHYKSIQMMHSLSVIGTFHGSIIHAKREGDARRMFHSFYNGESIIQVTKRPLSFYP